MLLREDFYAEIGRKIESKREQRGLTQTQVGDAVGVHRNSIYRWEAGTEMSLFDFLRVCNALSMPHTMMLPGAELPPGILLRQLIRERDPKVKVV